MKIYEAPKINQVAPNKRAHRWDEIKGIDAPFTSDPAPSEFGFWFNYFWAEAVKKPALTEAEKSKLSDMFFSVFEGGQGRFTPIAGLVSKEDSFKENVLRQILLVGFRRVALEPPQTVVHRGAGGRTIARAPLKAVDGALLNWDHAVTGVNGKLPIGFRSDTRSYDDLVGSRGFNPRARQGGWIYSAYAFDQRWNPFSNPVYNNSLFLRLGEKNKDACLQTVVSTGTTFHNVVHFPILNDYALNFEAKSKSGHFLAVKPAEMWTDEDIQLAASHRQKVRAVKGTGPGVDHLEKDNHIHVFHTTGLRGFNTGGYFAGKDQFPERSMEKVPLSNLLADIHFIQKWWYNPDERQIVLYDISFSPIRWVPNEQVVEHLLGAQGLQDLASIIRSEIQKSLARQDDVVPNGVAYRKFQVDKVRRLTAQELESVYQALQGHITGVTKQTGKKYAPNGKNEKTAVISALPNLKAKIEGAQLNEWADIRSEAIRRMG